MLELGNCDNCGVVFAKGIRDICPKCFNKEEEDFKVVYKFLMRRTNREATIPIIVEETGVGEDLIIKFMKQNRLRSAQFPMLAYDCEKCGVKINEGRICLNCSTTIKKQVEFHDEVERISGERKAEKKNERTFYTQGKK